MRVKILADSIWNGHRITTMECTYWRAIHSEVMTHRMFARNAASSRAIPFIRISKIQSTVAEIKARGLTAWKDGIIHNLDSRHDNELFHYIVPNCTYSRKPFLPMYLDSEQSGMQSGKPLDSKDREFCEDVIKNMYDYVLERCYRMYQRGLHKSIINRYLEPWTEITTIITATEWENFFNLRIDPAAEKHFYDLAFEMKKQRDSSVPVERVSHYPYIDDSVRSVARCARVSYLNQNNEESTAEEDILLYSKLLASRHLSPFEHPSIAADGRWGCFTGWRSMRSFIPNEAIYRRL